MPSWWQRSMGAETMVSSFFWLVSASSLSQYAFLVGLCQLSQCAFLVAEVSQCAREVLDLDILVILLLVGLCELLVAVCLLGGRDQWVLRPWCHPSSERPLHPALVHRWQKCKQATRSLCYLSSSSLKQQI